ncbi:MAG: hypothetical protein JO276_13900 [Sphingomonadaceae bacterium]|nr:hypothetical protein [Sphingomonadaceae bacterium]
MKARPALFLLALLLPAGCGEPAPSRDGAQGSTTPPYVRAEADNNLLERLETPVRVGELGPSFAACNARGTPRDRGNAEPVPVRAAPYDEAGEIDRLAAGAEFFICTRSQDEHWFGIVYDRGGQASERCGVGGPIPAPHNYLGPCAAGWVASASVRLTSGVPRTSADSTPLTR